MLELSLSILSKIKLAKAFLNNFLVSLLRIDVGISFK